MKQWSPLTPLPKMQSFAGNGALGVAVTPVGKGFAVATQNGPTGVTGPMTWAGAALGEESPARASIAAASPRERFGNRDVIWDLLSRGKRAARTALNSQSDVLRESE